TAKHGATGSAAPTQVHPLRVALGANGPAQRRRVPIELQDLRLAQRALPVSRVHEPSDFNGVESPRRRTDTLGPLNLTVDANAADLAGHRIGGIDAHRPRFADVERKWIGGIGWSKIIVSRPIMIHNRMTQPITFHRV